MFVAFKNDKHRPKASAIIGQLAQKFMSIPGVMVFLAGPASHHARPKRRPQPVFSRASRRRYVQALYKWAPILEGETPLDTAVDEHLQRSAARQPATDGGYRSQSCSGARCHSGRNCKYALRCLRESKRDDHHGRFESIRRASGSTAPISTRPIGAEQAIHPLESGQDGSARGRDESEADGGSAECEPYRPTSGCKLPVQCEAGRFVEPGHEADRRSGASDRPA